MSVTLVGRVAGALILGGLFGFVSWAAANYFLQPGTMAYAVGVAMAAVCSFAGWRWWEHVLDATGNELAELLLCAFVCLVGLVLFGTWKLCC